jgi:hypothetical protein
MSLDEEYPKTYRNVTGRLRALLEHVPGLPEREREELATGLNAMADKARDLDDIVQRLLNEPHTPEEIGQLLVAFEHTTEQIRGHSEAIDGKLYQIGDQLSATEPVSTDTIRTGDDNTDDRNRHRFRRPRALGERERRRARGR